MEAEKIYWKTALELIEKGETPENTVVDFKEEIVSWKEALLLGKNGIEVPEALIEYDDNNIDYSDNPAVTQEDLDTEKINWVRKAEIPIRKEIDDYLKLQNIDPSQLATELVENFYQTMKKVQNSGAL